MPARADPRAGRSSSARRARSTPTSAAADATKAERDRRRRRRGARRPARRRSSRSSVWQTGSGTQSNMNVNEVLANRASELLGGGRGAEPPRASRTTTSTSASRRTTSSRRRCTWPPRAASRARLLPALDAAARRRSTAKAAGVRRHRQDRPHAPAGRDAADAGPGVLRLRGAARPRRAAHRGGAAARCCELALGGTAVGTGLNTHPQFGARVAAELAARAPACRS